MVATTRGSTTARASPTSGLSVTIGKRKEEFTPQPGAVLGDARGRVRPGRAPRRHGPRRHPRLAVLPVVPALLRPDVLGGEGQGPRAALRAVVQRLDDRRVVRHRARSLHPADHHPALGPGQPPRSRWSGARRRARPRSRSPRTPSRSACPPSTTRTATGTRCWPPRRTCRWSCACTSARRRRCR